MNWPTAAVMIAFLVFAIFETVYASDTEHEKVFQVYDREGAWRVVMKTGETFVCMPTSEGFGFTGSDKWIGMTCAELGKPIAWQFCKGVNNTPMLVCVPPGTRVQGVKAEPRGKPDIKLGTGTRIL